ncbi:unnamed protein product, partial [Gordionus sp. m RMFG-2023]
MKTLLLISILLAVASTLNSSSLKDFPLTRLMQLGDVNIAGLFPIFRNSLLNTCDNTYDDLTLLKALSMIYVIEIWNDRLFLPNYNIRIGYYIVPTCLNPAISQIQAIILNKVKNVIYIPGVIGPVFSVEAMFTSPLLSFYKIPHISAEANSHHLSRIRYKYLFRITSDQYTYLNAMVKILTHFKWNQFSIIYSGDSYYSWYKKKLINIARDIDYCVYEQIDITMEDADLVYNNEIIYKSFQSITSNPKAKVIILLINQYQYLYVLKLFKKVDPDPQLIFIALDSWPGINKLVENGVADMMIGSIVIYEYGQDIQLFPKWLYNYTISKNNTDNKHPWLMRIGDIIFNRYTNYHNFDRRIALTMDATTAMLYSLDALIDNKCNWRLRQSPISNFDPRECIMENNLYPYLNNLSFNGLSGKIDFGAKDITKSVLNIANFIKLKGNELGLITIGRFETKDSETKLEIIMPFKWKNYTFSTYIDAPTSSCSAPCLFNEYKVTSARACCWVCYKCKVRAIFVEPTFNNNFHKCHLCSKYSWPNLNNTECLLIPIYHITRFINWYTFIKCLSSVGMICFILQLIHYFYYYDSTTFKLEYRPLLYFQYLGIFTGFISIFLLSSASPTWKKCEIGLFFYLLSIATIFSSMSSKQFIILKRSRTNVPNIKERNVEKRAMTSAITITIIQ